jgi:uncharacterized protein (TIGR02453 family)
MASSRHTGFEPETIKFLKDLKKNNNREWFNENKSRYEEQVLDVALHFIQSMQGPLKDLAPHFTAIPKRIGGSLMRVYRDTRFSKNKLPYKTNIGIQFRHEQAKSVHAPGYYVHIDPDEVFLGAGMWMPEAAPLLGIRQRIADKPAEWQRALENKAFARHFTLGGSSLTRPPRGFDKNHPMIEDIRRKSFIAVKNMKQEDALSPQFQRKVEAAFTAATPYMQFLCKSVGVQF